MNQVQAPKLSLFLFILLGAISAITPLAIDLYLPAMPAIADGLGTEANRVQVTLTIYTVGFALGQLLHGPLADSYGRKPVLVAGVAAFGLAAIGCTFAPNIDTLIAVRAIQGFAGAAAAVVIQAVVRDMFQREDFARTMSFITLVMTVAPLAAPLIGGYLSVFLGWRFIFGVLVVYSILIMIAILKYIPETLPVEKRQPLRLKSTLQNYARLLTNKVVLGLVLCGAFSFSGMFAFLTAGSFVYIDIYGVAPEHFGYLFGLNVVTLILMTTLNGRIVKQKGSHYMIRLGLTIQSIAGLGLLSAWVFDLGLWVIVPSVMLFVGVMSTIGSNTMALLLEEYPSIAGTASSLAGTLRFGVGGLVGFAITLMPSEQSWPMLVTMAFCSMLSVVFYFILGRKA
ncbi:multidrug transporter [Vibrio sp. qd031]|uniref:Bcr/CflA family multidrug efflux MFS transporter n=1 Tax=Vibrio sp. qd031 TaxID=1603038 RepID=UPI000A103B69|nr:Bcr/CflA family multidrug efflux MFS transporter [Vibrio sp. qd031]ORT49648.1 multidrug transporter [Vibrio sp. qd031]